MKTNDVYGAPTSGGANYSEMGYEESVYDEISEGGPMRPPQGSMRANDTYGESNKPFQQEST